MPLTRAPATAPRSHGRARRLRPRTAAPQPSPSERPASGAGLPAPADARGGGWHALSAAACCERLGVTLASGLQPEAAAARLRRHGENRLAERPRTPPWRVLLAQMQDLMVLVLLGAAAISFFLGETADGAVVLVIVVVNAILGFVQETRAERSLDALRRMTAPYARLRRGGREVAVPAEQVVPGDVLVLEAGDRVAADARLVEAASLAAEESAITGESRPSAKRPDVQSEGAVSLGDRHNMVFQGSHIARGRAIAVVVATGMATEMGRIAGMIASAGEARTPLQRRLDDLGKWLVAGCLFISGVVVVAGVLRGEPPYRMFLTGVSLAVAAIPEGLPAIVTIALALGVQRMIARHAIVRHLPAVETLGCATVICADKTGTLTQNRMAVRSLYADGMRYRVEPAALVPEAPGVAATKVAAHPSSPPTPLPEPVSACVRAAVLCNNAPASAGETAGNEEPQASDPTEVGLLRLAAASGASAAALRGLHPRIGEIPFESERRRMTVVCDGPDGQRVLVKGALEEVLSRSSWVATAGGRRPLDARRVAAIRREGEAMAGAALRVLALAERPWGPGAAASPADAQRRELSGAPAASVSLLPPAPTPPPAPPPDDVERDLTFCGLVGLMDPPRPEVPAAIRLCHRAGIRAVMITGDHALTARAVGEQVGLLRPGERVMTGSELAEAGERELLAMVDDVRVFARVSPADKLRVVRALHARGHVVAMTGDGVNDAPAVKEADIGVAMGRDGTDVTREASALVLTDDNFATIVAAVEEGRAIYDNIRKFIRYLLACNTGEVLVMLAGTLLGLPLPLLPLQLLLVNLVTDGLPALALGLDPPAGDVMRRPPRPPKEGVFAGGLGKRIAVRGVMIGAFTLAVFVAVSAAGGRVSAARTAATCTLVLCQLLHAFEARAERRSIWETSFRGNPALVLAVLSSLGILGAVLYIPAPRDLFGFAPAGGYVWGISAAAALACSLIAGLGEATRRAWARRTALVTVGRAVRGRA